MSAAAVTMPSLSRNPAVRSMSSPGVRMVMLTAWPPILMPSGSSVASRSALASGLARTGDARHRRRAARPVVAVPALAQLLAFRLRIGRIAL